MSEGLEGEKPSTRVLFLSFLWFSWQISAMSLKNGHGNREEMVGIGDGFVCLCEERKKMPLWHFDLSRYLYWMITLDVNRKGYLWTQEAACSLFLLLSHSALVDCVPSKLAVRRCCKWVMTSSLVEIFEMTFVWDEKSRTLTKVNWVHWKKLEVLCTR